MTRDDWIETWERKKKVVLEWNWMTRWRDGEMERWETRGEIWARDANAKTRQQVHPLRHALINEFSIGYVTQTWCVGSISCLQLEHMFMEAV